MISKREFQNKIFYEIILKSENLDDDYVACTGKQLIMIVNSLANQLRDYQWHIADIELNCYSDDFNDDEYILPDPKNKSLLIGNSECFIKYLKNVGQFMSGVFLGVKDNTNEISCENDEFWTEDRSPYLKLAEIDIRAFDTSFFILFTSDENIAKQINEDFLKNKT